MHTWDILVVTEWTNISIHVMFACNVMSEAQKWWKILTNMRNTCTDECTFSFQESMEIWWNIVFQCFTFGKRYRNYRITQFMMNDSAQPHVAREIRSTLGKVKDQDAIEEWNPNYCVSWFLTINLTSVSTELYRPQQAQRRIHHLSSSCACELKNNEFTRLTHWGWLTWSVKMEQNGRIYHRE